LNSTFPDSSTAWLCARLRVPYLSRKGLTWESGGQWFQPAATAAGRNEKAEGERLEEMRSIEEPSALYEHIKPDANLVISDYEPRHRGTSTIGGFMAIRHVRFGLGISRDSKLGHKADKRVEPNAGSIAGTRAEPRGENESYSNRGDRKTRAEVLRALRRTVDEGARSIAKPLRTVHGGREAAHETVEGVE